MATKKKAAPKKAAPTQESGTVFISSTGDAFTAPDVTATLLTQFQDNVYARGVSQTQKNIIFTEPAFIEVRDADGNQDDDLERDINKMFSAKDVSLNANIKKGWMDTFWFGPALYNDVWDWVDGTYTILKLRNLPAASFGDAPMSGTLDIYSQILRGITLHDGEVEYWQDDDARKLPEKVENVTMIKDPTSTELAGSSVMVPLVPIISMLKFVWDTQMQQANRTGAKILFLKVTDPEPASTANGDVGDIEAAREILEHWGKDNAFPLRGNMEIIDPGIKDDSNNLEIIAALNQMIIDYISPIDMLTSGNDGARLGGGDTERAEMIRRYIRSVHQWLEDGYSQFPQTYLDANGYDGYTARVVIPLPEKDMSALNLERAKVGIEAKVLSANALLRLIGEPEATDEELQAIEDYYARQSPTVPQFNFSAGVATSAEADEIPDKSTDSIEAVGDRLAKDTIAALELL